MEESLAVQVVRTFVAKINAHDADGLSDLMTAQHRCVDEFGETRQGRDTVRQWWRALFLRVPDYYIVCEKVISEGETVAVFGRAGGTYSADRHIGPASRWEVPAAWKVAVGGTRVAEWRVYMDTHTVRQIRARLTHDGATGDHSAGDR